MTSSYSGFPNTGGGGGGITSVTNTDGTIGVSTTSGVATVSAKNNVSTLTYSSSITPVGSAAKQEYDLTATGNFTLNAPSSPANKNEVVIEILASGGAWTVTLSGIVIPTLSAQTSPLTLASGKSYYIKMIYSSLRSQWQLVSFIGGY